MAAASGGGAVRAVALVHHTTPTSPAPLLVPLAPVVRVTPRPQRAAEADRQPLVVRVSAPVQTPTHIPAAEAVSVAPDSEAATTGAVVSTAGGAALMGLGMIISGTLGYVQTVAMTHMVPRSTFGIFVVVFTLATFLSQLTKLGLDGVLLRFLPAYRTQHERHLAAGLAIFSFWVPAAVGLVCALLLILFASPLARGVFHSEAYATPLREAALIIPLNGLQSVILNGLQAIKVFRWQVYVGKVIEPVVTLVMLTVFYLLGFRLEALIFAYIAGIGLSVVVGRVAFHRQAGRLIRAAPQYATATWMRFGAAMLFNVMTIAVIQSTDVLGLGAFDSTSQVSLYGAADRIGSLIAMPFFALSIIFSPMIAEMYTRGELPQLERMFALVTRWSLAVSWPVGLCCVIFSAPILGVFGKGYAAGSVALIVLAAGSLVNAGTGPVSNMLVMTSRLRVLWFNTFVRVTTNIVLVVLLIPRFGILGAALASSLTVVILNLVGLAEVWWIMKIQPYRWEMLKPLAAGGVAAVVGVLLVRLTHAGGPSASALADFGYSVGLVLAFLAIYMAALWRMGLTAEDRMVFAAIRGKFLRS